MKRKRNKSFIFDKCVEESIESLNITPSKRGKVRQFLWILMRDGREQNQDSFSFTQKPYKYWIKVFGGKYKDIVDVLKENKLIEVCDKYSTELHLSKRYKIAENLHKRCIHPVGEEEVVSPSCYIMSTQSLQLIDYETIKVGKIRVKNSVKLNNKSMDIVLDTEKNLSKLKVDELKLESSLKSYFNSIVPASFKTDFEINKKVFNYNDKYLTKDQALEKSSKMGVTIIEDYNGKIYFDNLTDFVNKKREAIFSSYYESILNLSEGHFYASRNETNNRLDTNLTNLPSLLLNVIKEDNDLVEIDLCNSQFAIFAHLIPEEVVGGDVELFKQLSQECELYPYLQEKMALSSRKEAKTVCFEVCFSSHKNHSQYVTEMRKLFPNVMRWVDNFKEKHGDNQFAIMLQKKEILNFH